MEEYSIGTNIKNLRVKHDMTHEELASKLNIPVNVLEDWEIDYGGPNGDQMMHLVDIFNVSYNQLAGRVNKTVWSTADILTMLPLALGIFMFFQPLLLDGTTPVVKYSILNIIVNFWGHPSPGTVVLLLSILSSFGFTFLLVMMFLTRQNPKQYQYFGNASVLLISVLLAVITVGLGGLIIMNYTASIQTYLFMLCGSLPTVFYLRFKNA